MDSFLESVGALVVMGLGFFWVIRHINKSQDRAKENRELGKYLNLNAFPWDQNRTYEENLRRILSDSSVRNAAKEAREKDIEEKLIREDEDRKKAILERTFSYEYENLLFEIFAPFATPRKYPSQKGEEWSCNERLEIEFVKNEIQRILNVTYKEAEDLVKVFESHHLLLYSISKQKCELGSILAYKWDIISKGDMNLTKWIDQHPNRESKDSAEQRRKKFNIVKIVPLSDYLVQYGDFIISHTGPIYYLYFNLLLNHIIIPWELYYKPESNNNHYMIMNEIKKILMNTTDFIVIDDDGHLTLRRK